MHGHYLARFQHLDAVSTNYKPTNIRYAQIIHNYKLDNNHYIYIPVATL